MKRLSDVPDKLVRAMRAMRAQGATFLHIRDWAVSQGLAISVSGVFTLCMGVPPPPSRKEAVRARVKAGMTRKAAALAEGVSPTAAQRWCNDLPRGRS